MKTESLRKPVGTATFEHIRASKYLVWQDAVEVEFESGVSFLVSNAELRRRNHLSEETTEVVGVWVEPELRSGFFVRYANGETAEGSWEFVKETSD
jgi:hypothetical protein